MPNNLILWYFDWLKSKYNINCCSTTSDGESADDESSNPETPHDSDEDTTGDSAQVPIK